MQQNSSKKEVYSNPSPRQETRKTLHRQHNLTPKATEKKNTKPPKLAEGKKSKMRVEMKKK